MPKISVLQMSGSISPSRNLVQIRDAVAAAGRAGATMLFTPEMSNIIDQDRVRADAVLSFEEADPVLSAVRDTAARHGLWVHIGSLALRAPNGKSLNRSFVIDSKGAIRAHYDKLHLFDVDLSNGESWRESASYQFGNRAVAVRTPIGLLGLAICYDVRFPALFQALSESGATILSVPAAFTRPTGIAHWETLLRARAIESACFVVAAAQTGVHEDGRATFGHSLVIDPWGAPLLDMGEESGLAFVEITLSRVDEVRARVPVQNHRRIIPPVEIIG